MELGGEVVDVLVVGYWVLVVGYLFTWGLMYVLTR